MAQWRAFVVILAPEPIEAANLTEALTAARAKFGEAAVVRVQSLASLREAGEEVRATPAPPRGGAWARRE
jgi:hypothetical protein